MGSEQRNKCVTSFSLQEDFVSGRAACSSVSSSQSWTQTQGRQVGLLPHTRQLSDWPSFWKVLF